MGLEQSAYTSVLLDHVQLLLRGDLPLRWPSSSSLMPKSLGLKKKTAVRCLLALRKASFGETLMVETDYCRVFRVKSSFASIVGW